MDLQQRKQVPMLISTQTLMLSKISTETMDNTDNVDFSGANSSAASEESLEFDGKTLFADSDLPGY